MPVLNPCVGLASESPLSERPSTSCLSLAVTPHFLLLELV